jgi:iron complex outermembrane recepter protein
MLLKQANNILVVSMLLFGMRICAPLYSLGNPIVELDSKSIHYLKTLSIEDLLKTTVTSVSKRPQSLLDAAAAVTVISAEDIRRSGARTIADLLRVVPGLSVSQIDSSRWEVGARGFSDYFENKLLVLMDGRSMYTPLYAGVYWNSLDTILEDIDRIEVIRGPGATVWGANAVNGVINIITKSSRVTQGGLASVTYGTWEQPLISLRYGDSIDEESSYRVYAKGFQRESFENSSGGDANDSWESYRTGMRVDQQLRYGNRLSFQAELFDGSADFKSALSGYLTPPFFRESNETEKFSGGHLLLNYQHSLSQESVVDINFYYDGYTRDLTTAKEKRDTLAMEIQHHNLSIDDHDIVWGAGVTWSEDDIAGTYFSSLDPQSESNTLWSAFVQDDMTIIDRKAWITLGTKVEHNEFSGLEVQPSLRLRYKPAENQLLWAAVSRAVRTPSRSEQDIVINLATFSTSNGDISQLRLSGNDEFDSETLIAYELGYRWQIPDKISFDVASFFNEYDDLRSVETGQPFLESEPLPPHLVIPEFFVNELEGRSYGIEIASTWQARMDIKLSVSYAWVDLDLQHKDPSFDSAITAEENFPRQQVTFTSKFDVQPKLALDAELYYVDEYRADEIDDYLRFDLQLTWRPADSFQLALGGENLFTSRHQEAVVFGSGVVSSEVPVQYWLKGTYLF